MPRKDAVSHTRVPPSLAPVLRSFIDRYGEPERWARTEIHRPWVVVSRETVGYLAYDEASLERLERERTRLLWARSAGVPTPEIVEDSDTMFVTSRSPIDPPSGARYVELAVEAAMTITAAEPPPLSKLSGRRRASKITLPIRGARAVAGGLDPRRFISAKRAASMLPRDALSHGDFHTNNVLFDSGAERVVVIDWSYLGFQPRWTDLVYFWTRLPAPQDRALLADRLIELADDHRHLGALLRWIAIRSYAEMVTDEAWRRRDRVKLEQGRLVMDEAEKIAQRIEGMADAG